MKKKTMIKKKRQHDGSNENNTNEKGKWIDKRKSHLIFKLLKMKINKKKLTGYLSMYPYNNTNTFKVIIFAEPMLIQKCLCTGLKGMKGNCENGEERKAEKIPKN